MSEELNIEEMLKLRRLVDVLYDTQEVRMRTANRLRLMPKDVKETSVDPMLKVEADLTKQIEGFLARVPIYTDFLYHVRGVGPRISGCIISQTAIKFDQVEKEKLKNYSETQQRLSQKTEKGLYLVPVPRGIGAFDTVSKYWKWWGLGVTNGEGDKRRRGQTLNYNPKMKTLAWKIGKQFVMQGERYKMHYKLEKMKLTAVRLPLGVCHKYEECMKKLTKRKTPACKGHVDAMARRKAVKLFVSHVWERWRILEDLPVRVPYAHEYLGHTTKQEPGSE